MTGARSVFLGAALVLLAIAVSARSVEAQAPGGFVVHATPQPLTEIAFKNGEDEPVTLGDFRGEVVLLNIWATWCAPCRREMPTLDRLQAELGGPDFEVVALSLDRQGWSVVLDFYHELGLRQLGVYVDPSGKAQRELKVLGIPTTLLIDREGNELGRLLGPAEWDSARWWPSSVATSSSSPERQWAANRRSCSSRSAPYDLPRVSVRSKPFLPKAGSSRP